MAHTPSPNKRSGPAIGIDDSGYRSSNLEALASDKERYVRSLFAQLRRVLAHEEVADAVQEAFLRALSTEETQSLSQSELETWIRTTAHNVAVDLIRKREG